MFAKKKKTEYKKAKKIPNKYKGVKKTLNTGLTVNDVILLTNNQVVKKKSEIFKRIATKKLHYIINNDPLSESIITTNQENDNQNINLNNFTFSKSFLLIDLRNEKEYDKFHIKNCDLKSFINSFYKI